MPIHVCTRQHAGLVWMTHEMVEDVRTRLRRRSTLLLVLVALQFASCSSASNPPDDLGSASDAYALVIEWFVQSDRGRSDDPLVFVIALGDGTSIGLETQAAVVASTEAVADVRFVDDRSEAFKDGGVREGAIFIALGPIVRTGRRASIDCDEILTPRTELHWKFKLRSGERWTIVGEPQRRS